MKENICHSELVSESQNIDAPYELPEGWNWTQAKDIADIYTGNSINEKVKAEKYAGQKTGLNFIGTKDVDFDGSINYENGVKITDFENFKTAPENTALLCIEGGSAGKKLGFTEEKVCFGNKLCAFVSKNIEPKLIYYYLQSNVFFYCFMKERHGLIGGVSVNTLKHLPFPLPLTLAEQQRIVSRIESLFTKLDEAKDKAQSVVDGFELRRAAILHKAFTGELTAKWRKENGVKDESWEEKRFDEFCLLKRGFDLPATQRIEGKFPLVSSSGIIDSHNEPKVKAPCVVTGRSGSIGKVFYITEDCFPLNTTLYSEKLFDNDAKYVYLYLQTFDFKKYSSSTAVPTLNRNNFADVPVKVPTFPEQQEIVRILDSVLEKEADAKETAERVLEQIDLLKKSILARAFRGEL